MDHTSFITGTPSLKEENELRANRSNSRTKVNVLPNLYKSYLIKDLKMKSRKKGSCRKLLGENGELEDEMMEEIRMDYIKPYCLDSHRHVSSRFKNGLTQRETIEYAADRAGSLYMDQGITSNKPPNARDIVTMVINNNQFIHYFSKKNKQQHLMLP
ncbi:hypothetical protein LguiB_020452 [Lonicera macranthoides]